MRPRTSSLRLRAARRARPRVEPLEPRCLPAQVLFGGGSILKETFDDPPDLPALSRDALTVPLSFDDIGRITSTDPVTGQITSRQTHAVFHHEISSGHRVVQAYFDSGGTTTPILPTDSARDLFLLNAQDDITFPDVDPRTEGVALAAIDVQRTFPSTIVLFQGTNGSELATVHNDAPGLLFTATGGSQPARPGRIGVVGFADPPLNSSFVDVVATADDLLPNGLKLGPIQRIGISGFGGAIDNLRVLITPLSPVQPPVAADDSFTVLADSSNNALNVLANDRDPNGEALHIVGAGSSFHSGHGTVKVLADHLEYTPTPGYVGPDSFGYTIQNVDGATASATVTVQVHHPPVANDVTIRVSHDFRGPLVVAAAQGLNQAPNVSDPDGNSLTVVLANLPLDDRFGDVMAFDEQTGAFTYTPSGGGLLHPDEFTYQARDAFGLLSAPAKVHIIVDNSTPVALDQTIPLLHQPASQPVLGRVTWTGIGDDPVTVSVVSQPAHGLVAISNPADGSFVYDPGAAIDSFTFRVTDNRYFTVSNVATVTVNIQDVAPVLGNASTTFPVQYIVPLDFDSGGTLLDTNDDGSRIDEGVLRFAEVSDGHGQLHDGSTLGFDILAAQLTAVLVRPPLRGSFRLRADGTFTYQPLPGFSGRDTFDFKVNDGLMDSNVMTVPIFVQDHQGRLNGSNTAWNAVVVRDALGGRDVELEAPPFFNIRDASAVANPAPDGSYPPGTSPAAFPAGFFHFVVGVEHGGAQTVTIHLPPGLPNQQITYYKFGATPGNLSPHWYPFMYDPAHGLMTGAETHYQNPAIPTDEIVLHFIDGQLGDDDLSANGVIVDDGGPAFLAAAGPAPSPGDQAPAPPAPAASPEAALVAALYRALLNRDPDPDGLASWAGQITAGASFLQVVRGIEGSPEHRGLQVDRLYATYLHRAADAPGRAFWVDRMTGGMSEEDVAVALLLSPEYRASHPDAASFVSGLYGDVLGRGGDAAGTSSWLGVLAKGDRRADVARAFLAAPEERWRAIDAAFQAYLHRSAGPAADGASPAWLQAGATAEAVTEALLTSDEFAAGARGGRPVTG
jgi:hypothetical protein